ncbi:MAG: GHKL domain-containing protein [Burkholderiales bacterium]|nr:GHKL domain-containing protein [Burkholderiales bacterium]
MGATVPKAPESGEINLLLMGFHQADQTCTEIKRIADLLAQHLVFAKDLRDLLLKSETSIFSALLVDVNALEIDAVMEDLRGQRQLRDLPLLFLSNTPFSVMPIQSGSQGRLVDMILKPIQAEVLHQKLDGLLRLARQALRLKQQEERIQTLEVALQQANKNLSRREIQLQQANEELNQFSYIASHDLREPLRMVSSFMELLRERYQVHLDEQARKFIYFAVDGAVRMNTLINGIVEFNHIGRSTRALELISVNMVVEAALINLSARLNDSHAEVICDELPEVYADRAQLSQVFECILDNAMKFRSERPLTIHISVQREPHAWVFSILDNGIGFDETQSKRVFALFQTLHERDKYHGHGTGLAMAKKIIELYGGEIWVGAVSSQGSRFDFRWPIEEWVD